MRECAEMGMRHIPTLFRRHGRLHRISGGQQIFQKDDPADVIYYLESGKVRAYLLYPDGLERTLCFVERGNLVGEEAVARPPVRIVCTDAATDLLLYSMDAKSLLSCCAGDQESLSELMALFMKKIQLLSSWIFYAQFTRNDAKLACFLYSNTESRNEVRYTQAQMAAVTGMSRVSVSNCLRDFERQGMIGRGYRRILVTDRPGLRKRFGEREFY